jgi:predicted HicB family RNase H-like nuclease
MTRTKMSDLYRYSVSWSEEDGVFVSRVAEFSLLAAHGDTPEEALQEIRQVVQSVLQDLEASEEPIPPPFSTRPYSGKINLRMPESLHRQLAIEAEQQGVSLNQWINRKLSQY